MPSATKNVAPTAKSVAVSSTALPALAAASPKKNRATANRPRITASVKADTNTIPSSVATKPARLTAAGSLRPTACPTRTVAHSDAEWHHEQDGGHLQSDLMRRQRGGADQAHQKRRGGEQAIFQQERDGDRRADHDQLPQQRPVDAPDVFEYTIFPERPAGIGKPERCQKHA